LPALAEVGANVVVQGRSAESFGAAVSKLKAEFPQANIDRVAADPATAAGCALIVKTVPQVDLLVNNLGIYECCVFEDIRDEDWQRFFDINVTSGVRLSRAYLPGMKAQNWGRIVFISSESALHIPDNKVHYGMTKTTQIAVARGIAETSAGTGVTRPYVRNVAVEKFASGLDSRAGA
jgi:NAD(P)-dependent dehydrogenase (short-subunit alcohol dehydrogenase family)